MDKIQDVYQALSPGLRAALDAAQAKEGAWHTLSIKVKRTGETLEVIDLKLLVEIDKEKTRG